MPRKKVARSKAPGRSARRKNEVEHTLERGTEHFGEEVHRLGERLSRKMEKKGEEWDSWFHSTFGILGPVISSIFGLVILGLAVWALMFVNMPVGSGALYNIQYFLLANMGLFFLIFMFFSYSSYFSKVSPRLYMPFSPIVTAAGISIGFWFAVHAINITNLSLEISLLSDTALFMEKNLFLIFCFFLFVGYMVLLVKIGTGKAVGMAGEKTIERRSVVSVAKRFESGKARRLYRSGQDRILGGVCGGIAEYLGIDPTIVRILWVIGTLAWGFGILLYIIMWIIVPRNPSHKWD